MFRITCPHCRAVLKSQKPLPAGKEIGCLKCHQRIKIAAETAVTSGAPSTGASLLLTWDEVIEQSGGMTPEARQLIRPRERPRGMGKGLIIAGILLALAAGGGLTAVFVFQDDLFPQNENPQPIIASISKEPPNVPVVKLPIPEKKQKEPKPREKKTTPRSLPGPILIDTKKNAVGKKEPEHRLGRVPQEKIDGAIDKGVAYLKETVGSSGCWPGGIEEHQVGYAALPAWALLECKVPPSDPAIQKAAAFVRNRAPTLNTTYDLGTTILFLDRLGDPGDRKLIQSLALRLVAGQTASGGWHYKCPILGTDEAGELLRFLQKTKPKFEFQFLGLIQGKPGGEKIDPVPPPPQKKTDKSAPGIKTEIPKGPKVLSPRIRSLPIVVGRAKESEIWFPTGRDDNSNTHFALLGLWAARRHQVPTELSLDLASRRYQKTQNEDGGWGYVMKAPSKNSMTCVGLLGLAMGHGGVAEALAATKKIPPVLFQDSYIKNSLASLGRYVDEDDSRRGLESRVDFYFLWTLERTCILYNLKTVGKKDWYQWGARIILSKQETNGSWRDHYDSPIDTSLALLFLRRSNPIRDLSDNLSLFLAIPDPDRPQKRLP